MHPGDNALQVKVKDSVYEAHLLGTGKVSFQGVEYDTPTAFRRAAVEEAGGEGLEGDKREGDGWGSVTYKQVALEELRRRLLLGEEEGDARASMLSERGRVGGGTVC